VHLCQSADSRIGGSLVVARDLVAKQVELGIDARLLYLYRSAQPTADRPRELVPSVSLDIDRSQRYGKGIRELRRTLRELRPDVIHHHDGVAWTRLVTPGLGVPLVTHGHSEPPEDWIGRLIQRLVMRGTQRMIAVSEWAAAGWVAAGFPRERISVVTNGVDCARFRPRSAEARTARLAALKIATGGTRILFWAGRLERARKGLDRLVQVGKDLPADWTCIIAGDGTDREWLATQIETLPNKGQFRMLGNVTDAEEWFGICDAYLFTSTVEPFGLVVLEAAASGLPVMCFTCSGGAMELLTEIKADFVDGYDKAALARVFQALAAPGKGAIARHVVEESYTWDRVARRTIEIYRELLGVKKENPAG
jgi:glycosyltransferase involved in cell wall biosynthesis